MNSFASCLPAATHRRKSARWRRAGLLLALAAAACENPAAPVACGPLPQVTVNVGETSSVTACFNDANGDMLTYSATSSNPRVATATIAGTSITVTALAPGNTTVTVTAGDPGGLQGQQSFQVMVPNRPPLPQGSLPNIEVEIGETAMVDASQYFREPDGEALTYSASPSDAAVAGVSVAGSIVTVAAEAKGSATITITATDPGGLSAVQSFRFTAPNRPPAPVGTIEPQTIEVDQSVTLDAAVSFSDPDGDALTYTASSANPTVARTSVSGRLVTITAVGPGATTITITARDTDQATATQTVSVTVPQPNRRPQRVGTIAAQSVVEGQRVNVNASIYFRDPDGDPLTYSATSSNTTVASVSVSGAVVTIRGVSAGSATVTVTARDPDGLSATQSTRVTVTPSNRAPRAVGTIPSQSVEPGGRATVILSPYFTDPDGDALTYSAVSSNAVVASVSVLGAVVTIRGVSAGSATVTVTARDPDGLSATQSTRVTVTQSNRAPRAVGTIPSQSVAPGGRATVTLSSYFTDPDGDALTYSATSSNTTVASVSVSGAVTTIRGISAGNATVTVTARDPGGLSATQTISVRVASAGPDLRFTDVTPTSVTGSPGGSVQATFTLRNSGDVAAAATTIRVYQSSNSTISTSDTEIGSHPMSSLAAGRNSAVTATVTLPSQASGTFYFGLCVDAVPGESNTQNNCSSGVRVTVGGSGAPDLVVRLSRSSVTVSPGSSFTYEVTIRNQGDAASSATTVRTYQSSNSTISTSDTEIGQSTVPAIDPSQQVGGTHTVSVPTGTPEGTIYIGNCVDAVSEESNTDNNCSSAITVTIQSASDTTYTTGQTITTLPTGSWVPNQLGGGTTFQSSGGSVTITFSGTSSYMIHNGIRYSCLNSGGCQIVNRRVTRGSIRATTVSGSNATAGQIPDGRVLRSVTRQGAFVPVRSDDDRSSAWQVAEVILRINPGGEP